MWWWRRRPTLCMNTNLLCWFNAEVAWQGLNTTPTCFNTLADQPKILDTLSPVVSVCEVSKLLQSTPNKSNTLDFHPTKLLNDYHTLWAPIITNMASLSFSTGTLPSFFKFASHVLQNWKNLVYHWTIQQAIVQFPIYFNFYLFISLYIIFNLSFQYNNDSRRCTNRNQRL